MLSVSESVKLDMMTAIWWELGTGGGRVFRKVKVSATQS